MLNKIRPMNLETKVKAKIEFNRRALKASDEYLDKYPLIKKDSLDYSAPEGGAPPVNNTDGMNDGDQDGGLKGSDFAEGAGDAAGGRATPADGMVPAGCNNAD